jgi:hypothetical protein
MLTVLAEAVDDLEIPADGDTICDVLALIDQLNAKVTQAVGRFDAEAGWAFDACTSMTAWLKYRARLSAGAAASMVRTAHRLADLPVTSAAWVHGELSGAQIHVILANINTRTAALFAEHEAALIPTFEPLTVTETTRAMQEWQAQAKALLNIDDEPRDDTNTAHLSGLLDGRKRLDATLDGEAAEVVSTALRLATTRDTEAEPPRNPGRRRADALVDVCRFFLDHRPSPTGVRNRPHLNVMVDYDSALCGGQGHLVGGPFLDGPSVRRILCDAGVNRVVTDGRSAIIDFGTTTYQAPTALFNALVLRDQGCRHPGCDRGWEWCEAHHVIPFPHGPTNLHNLVLKCSRHHHIAHQPGWHEKLQPDATLTLTDPQGRQHTSRPRLH